MEENSSEKNVKPSHICMERSETVVNSIRELSVLVIMYPGKWHSDKFHPNCYSTKIIDWFEGTGTIIGIKRNRVFILSSIHCIPGTKYSFFLKGTATNHEQVPITLVLNYFIEENNGIDIAVFSCDARHFSDDVLSRVHDIEWSAPDSFRIGSKIWLVHFPTSSEPNGVVSTHRLFHECFPTISTGTILSEDFNSLTIDSTIIATGGSSGGLIVDEEGRVIAVHDSQHDETPDHTLVSTHRMVRELRQTFKSNKQLCNLFS